MSNTATTYGEFIVELYDIISKIFEEEQNIDKAVTKFVDRFMDLYPEHILFAVIEEFIIQHNIINSRL